MSDAARDAVLREQLQTLKLAAVARDYLPLARQARDAGWAYEDYLRELLDSEIRGREERTAARRLREARLPDVKTLDQIDWPSRASRGRRSSSWRAASFFVAPKTSCSPDPSGRARPTSPSLLA